ncbi:DinB family protein [Immundisolibacter sp.]|uniref:DinB family protein n=1 Tax=Immundisolibacter sp. TaxID=1934948 RepID=UPI00260DD07C|nr:DinB family protein [Immundisolibacter sp.]MDD3651343.1 DinB family protein [Immundisolibacter sp.]
MDALKQLRLSAAYNRWVNTRLYDACAGLSAADYKADLGAFFRSVHGTLNHLLLGDLLWLARIRGTAPPTGRLDAELAPDLPALRRRQAQSDAALCDYLQTCREADLPQPVRYTSVMTGKAMSLPRWTALTHLFNHQIHHRGQLTALLSRLGVDYGNIDLVWMPGVAHVDEAGP